MASVMNSAVQTGPAFSALTAAIRDVFSAEMWFSALPIMKFDQFSTKKTELGVQPGRTIQMPKMSNLKRGGFLREGQRMQSRSMNISTTSLSVDEVGNAVSFTEALLQYSFYDQLTAASLLLGRDMAVVLDTQLRDVAVGAPSVIYAGEKSARTDLTISDGFDSQIVRAAGLALETMNAPKWAGDHYICFLSPHQGSYLRRDQAWINASLYSGSGQIYTGEIGRFEDVRFISTTVMPTGANGAIDPDTGDYANIGHDPTLALGYSGNQVDVYQAVFFGEYSVGHATTLPVELRDSGVVDYGREHGVAWYAIWGSGRLESQNIVVAESA